MKLLRDMIEQVVGRLDARRDMQPLRGGHVVGVVSRAGAEWVPSVGVVDRVAGRQVVVGGIPHARDTGHDQYLNHVLVPMTDEFETLVKDYAQAVRRRAAERAEQVAREDAEANARCVLAAGWLTGRGFTDLVKLPPSILGQVFYHLKNAGHDLTKTPALAAGLHPDHDAALALFAAPAGESAPGPTRV